MTLLSLKVLLDHIVNYLLGNDDKDNLLWFTDSAFLVHALLCGRVGVLDKYSSGGNDGGGGRRKAKGMVWSIAAMHSPGVSSSLLSSMHCHWCQH